MGFSLSKLIKKPVKVIGKIGKKIEKTTRPGFKAMAPALAEGGVNAFLPGVGTLVAKPMVSAMTIPTTSALANPGGSPFVGGMDWHDVAGGAVDLVHQIIKPRPTAAVPYDGGAQPVGTAGVVVSGAAALIRALLLRASQFLGKRVTRASALDLIKRWGPTAAASALGWSVAETVQFWMATGGSKPRRRRGLTYRQISNARRVAGTLRSMQRSFSEACSSVGYARRRSSAPAKKRCR